jgi:hypothetical protein
MGTFESSRGAGIARQITYQGSGACDIDGAARRRRRIAVRPGTCDIDAKYFIRTGPGDDDWTHGCTIHVGELLTAGENSVWLMSTPGVCAYVAPPTAAVGQPGAIH